MLPWTRKKNTNIFHQEFTQQSVPNRIFNRLLDNDKYLNQRVDSLSAAPVSIPFATSAEVEAHVVSGKAISPDTIMAISATEADIASGSDTKFVTVNGHLNNLQNLSSTLSFIDITHTGEYEQWPSASAIEEAAKEVLGDYVPADDTPVSVVFRYVKRLTTKKRVRSGHRFKIVVDYVVYRGLARYRFLAKTSGSWEYEGRIINDKGKLYE